MKLTRRIKSEGRWADFVARRTALTEADMKPMDRYDTLEREFPPFDKDAEHEAMKKSSIAEVDAKESEAKGESETQIIDRLCAACVGRESTEPRSIRWVFEHIGVSWADIDVDGIPSRGAVMMLKTAMGDHKWFLREMWKPLIKTADEGGGAFKDDGREVLELIDTALAEGGNGSPTP